MRWRPISRTLLVAVVVANGVVAADDSGSDIPDIPALEQFLSYTGPSLTSFRAVRRLEAGNQSFNAAAWMDVLTEADASGFRYEVLAEGGSGYIRSKVFRRALETEQERWGSGTSAAFTPENYVFEDRGVGPGGLARVGVTPRRKDVLLVNGSIFLQHSDGDLVRVQGTLAKTPSFWTRKVEIVGHYDRIAGVRLPVRFESVANIFLAGKATLTMTYDYEIVNGVACRQLSGHEQTVPKS